MNNTCSFPGCNNPIFVQQTSHGGLCNGHYAQHRRKKVLHKLRGYKPRDPGTIEGTCPIESCSRPSWHKHGYCQSHQRQIYANKITQPIREYNFQEGQTCQYDDCDEPAKSRGFCSKHYRSDWGNCKEPRCDRRMHNKKTGLCASHYARYRKALNKVEDQVRKISRKYTGHKNE